ARRADVTEGAGEGIGQSVRRAEVVEIAAADLRGGAHRLDDRTEAARSERLLPRQMFEVDRLLVDADEEDLSGVARRRPVDRHRGDLLRQGSLPRRGQD